MAESKRVCVELVCADGVRVSVPSETANELSTLRDMLSDLGPGGASEKEEVPLLGVQSHVLRQILHAIQPVTGDSLADSLVDLAELLASADHLGAPSGVVGASVERIARVISGRIKGTGDKRWPGKHDFEPWVELPTADSAATTCFTSGHMFSPDKSCAVIERNGMLQLMDLTSPMPAFMCPIGPKNRNHSIKFSSDSARLFVADSHRLRAWDTRSAKLSWEALFRDLDQEALARVFCQTNRWIAVANANRLKVWDVSTGTPLHDLPIGGSNSSLCIDIHPDGNRCVVCMGGRATFLVDIAKGTVAEIITPLKDVTVGDIVVSKRSVISSFVYDHRISVVDIETGSASIHGADVHVGTIAVSPDGTVLAGIGRNKECVCVWRLDPFTLVSKISFADAAIEMAFETNTTLRIATRSRVVLLRRIRPDSVLVSPNTAKIVENMMQLYDTLHARVPLLGRGVWLEVIEKLIEVYPDA